MRRDIPWQDLHQKGLAGVAKVRLPLFGFQDIHPQKAGMHQRIGGNEVGHLHALLGLEYVLHARYVMGCLQSAQATPMKLGILSDRAGSIHQ